MNSKSFSKIQDMPDYSKVINISKVEGLFKSASSRFYELPNENNSNKVTLTWKNIDFLLDGVDLKEYDDHVYLDINMILEDLHSDDGNNLFGKIKLNINQSFQNNGEMLLDLGLTKIRNEDRSISYFLISSSKIIDLSGKFESVDFVELYLKLNKQFSKNFPPYKNDIFQKKKLFNSSEENIKLLMEDITKNAKISVKLYARNNITRFIPTNVDLSNGSKNVKRIAKGCDWMVPWPTGNCGFDSATGADYECVGCNTRACNCDCRCNGLGEYNCGCGTGCDYCSGIPCPGCPV